MDRPGRVTGPVDGPQADRDLIRQFLAEAAEPAFVSCLSRDLLLELYTKILEMPDMSMTERVDTLNQLRRYKRQLERDQAARAGNASPQPPGAARGSDPGTRKAGLSAPLLISADLVRYRLIDSVRLRVL